uniref:Uncharacterized protein n=1 Tax=Pinguiococcus pyrenoidosus TaxID=172671 RepID=A0A7R9U253_9STRA|mmetsp:Transcript_11794/g.43926  ORF Transcript_11794/g.43926 Transcript_11794/m.43926 type:complete len:308 (+) Transcript_11794:145-1068(+)
MLGSDERDARSSDEDVGKCGLSFGWDARGEEVLLMHRPNGDDKSAAEPYKGENRVVMMEWEKPYMEALVEALRLSPRDDVLEIGFGCGYSALAILDASPRSHCIIECDPVVLRRARRFAEFGEVSTVVEGTWQAVLGGTADVDADTDAAEAFRGGTGFSAVFYDDFPLPVAGADRSDLVGSRTRWCWFLRALQEGGHLRHGARVTGYLARPLEPLELEEIRRRGFVVASMQTTDVSPSPLCPYFRESQMYIPVFAYQGGRKPSDGSEVDHASLDQGTVDVDRPREKRSSLAEQRDSDPKRRRGEEGA